MCASLGSPAAPLAHSDLRHLEQAAAYVGLGGRLQGSVQMLTPAMATQCSSRRAAPGSLVLKGLVDLGSHLGFADN